MDLSQVCSRVRQRYFVVVMCLFGISLTYMNYFTFNLLIQEMSYSTKERSYTPPCKEDTEEARSAGKEELLWGPTLQKQVMTGWLYGKLLGGIPLALLTDKFGAKTIFGFSIFISGICSAITPLFARSSPYMMLSVRVINSFFASTQTVTQAWMAARWFPPRTRGLMLSLVYTGYPLGAFASLWINHLYIHFDADNWRSICYLNGCLSIVFAYFWQLLVWDDPFEHPYVSDDELILLATQVPMYAQETELQPGWRWPWKSMLKSRYLWLISFALIGEDCSWSFVMHLVTFVYFPDVLVFDLTKHEGKGTLVFLSMVAGMIVGGAVGDWVGSARHWLSVTQLTKAYFVCNCVLSPLIHIALVLSGCDFNWAMVYFAAAMFCQGFSSTNWTNVCLHMAPNFVATTMAFTALPRIFISPAFYVMNSYIVNLPIRDSWENVAYLNAVVSVFTTAIFLQCGKVEQQPWNVPDKTKEEDEDGSDSLSKHNQEDIQAEDNEEEPGDKRKYRKENI